MTNQTIARCKSCCGDNSEDVLAFEDSSGSFDCGGKNAAFAQDDSPLGGSEEGGRASHEAHISKSRYGYTGGCGGLEVVEAVGSEDEA